MLSTSAIRMRFGMVFGTLAGVKMLRLNINQVISFKNLIINKLKIINREFLGFIPDKNS